jgi:hemerythrin
MIRRPCSIVQAMTLARNRLLALVRDTACESDEHFAGAFLGLVAAVECAFRNEETLMESAGHPALRNQRQDNALLLSALHHATSQVEAGKLGVGREVVTALPGLLSLHRFSALRMLAYRITDPHAGLIVRKVCLRAHAGARRAHEETR